MAHLTGFPCCSLVICTPGYLRSTSVKVGEEYPPLPSSHMATSMVLRSYSENSNLAVYCVPIQVCLNQQRLATRSPPVGCKAQSISIVGSYTLSPLKNDHDVLQRVSLGALSDVTVVLGMRQSIVYRSTHQRLFSKLTAATCVKIYSFWVTESQAVFYIPKIVWNIV